MSHASPFPRETPYDPVGRLVETPGGPAHVLVDGDLQHPCVVFVHGIPGNTRDARYLGPALARRGLCCVRLDLPGFGRTAVEVMPAVDCVQRAAFVRFVVRALGVTRYAPVGHSIGGPVALALAARHPDEVSALALLNSVGVQRHRGMVVPAAVHRAMAKVSATPLGHTMAARLERYYEGRGNKSEAPLEAAMVAHHLGVVGALDFVQQRAHAHAVQAPCLVVSADDDPFIQAPVATSLVRALTGAPFVTHLRMPRGGHHGQKIAASPIADWFAQTLGRH